MTLVPRALANALERRRAGCAYRKSYPTASMRITLRSTINNITSQFPRGRDEGMVRVRPNKGMPPHLDAAADPVPQIHLPVGPGAWARSSRYTGRHHLGLTGRLRRKTHQYRPQ